MFKENFIRICNAKGESPSYVCKQVGLSNAAYSQWKDDSIPRKATLQKLSDYLGVSVSDLIGNTDTKEPVTTEDDELTEYLEELKNRPEMRMLFSLAKGATKEDVEQAVAIIEALRKTKNE